MGAHLQTHTHATHTRTYGPDVISKDDKQTGYLFGHYVFVSDLELNITDFCQRFSFVFLVLPRNKSEYRISDQKCSVEQ